jgi:type I restriction enzyme M protein
MLDSTTKRRIDTARDILVGKVPDPKTQVEQITFAMIYKFMDDMDQLSLQLGGKASFFANGYELYAWSNLMDRKLGGAARMDLYVRALEGMATNPHIPQLFRDIFKGAFMPYRDAETLNLFLKEMNGFTYAHSEDLGDAYEYLLAIFASQGKAGQFRTPRHIIDFIVDCVNPAKEDSVLDPACGTAGFLISAYKHILEQNRETPLSGDERGRLTANFVGYDISPDMVRLSRVNMYLHQFPNPTIHEYDTLTYEDRWDETYDVILANPPFMSPKGGIRPHTRFAVQANRSEVLFVDYIAEHLNPSGRAGVIVPEGIIFQSANAYKALRKMLVDGNYLVAVISLPAGIFQPYSGVKTSVLLMDKDLAKRTNKILFVKVAADGYDLGAQRREIERNDLPEALRMVKAFQADPDGEPANPLLARVFSKAQLGKDGEYNLSAERYKILLLRDYKWPMVPIGDVCEIQSGFGFPVSFQGDLTKEIPFLKVSDMNLIGNEIYIRNWNNTVSKDDLIKLHAKSSPPGTIIFPKIGAAIATNKKRILSVSSTFDNNVMGLISSERINPTYLYYLLTNIDISAWASDSSLPSMKKSYVEKVTIPLPPLEVQQAIVNEIGGYQKIIDGARQVVENYKPVIKLDPSWPMVKLREVIKTLIPPKKLQKDEYFPFGEFPIIDQSQSFIAGSTDNSDAIIAYENPLVIFGDHTCIIKYVDFPFAQGADGIKIIDPSEKFIPKFFYYLIQTMEIESEGYKRHFTNFKELIIPLPPLETQQIIVEELDQESYMIEINRKLIEYYDTRIKSKVSEVWEKC